MNPRAVRVQVHLDHRRGLRCEGHRAGRRGGEGQLLGPGGVEGVPGSAQRVLQGLPGLLAGWWP